MSDDAPLRVVMLRRARLDGRLYRPGEVVTVGGSTPLRCAAGLVATRQAKPFDAATRLDVALFLALQALPDNAAP